MSSANSRDRPGGGHLHANILKCSSRIKYSNILRIRQGGGWSIVSRHRDPRSNTFASVMPWHVPCIYPQVGAALSSTNVSGKLDIRTNCKPQEFSLQNMTLCLSHWSRGAQVVGLWWRKIQNSSLEYDKRVNRTWSMYVWLLQKTHRRAILKGLWRSIEIIGHEHNSTTTTNKNNTWTDTDMSRTYLAMKTR